MVCQLDEIIGWIPRPKEHHRALLAAAAAPPVRGALYSSRPRTIRAPLRSSASRIVRSLVHTGQIADLRQIHMRGGRLTR